MDKTDEKAERLSDEEFTAGCALLRACAEDNVVRVRELLAQSNNSLVAFKDYDRRTALHVACFENFVDSHEDVIELMINKHAFNMKLLISTLIKMIY